MSDILMGRWDCDSCGAVGILGDGYSCSSCGAPRPEDVRFYLPQDAEAVTDAAGVAAAEAGSDWQCEYCSSWLPATQASCDRCGGGEAASGKRQSSYEYASRAAVPTSAAAAEIPVLPTVPVARPASGSSSGLSTGVKLVLALILLPVFCCCSSGLLSFLGLLPDPVWTVSGHRWETRIEQEELRAVEQGGWTLPADARNAREEQRVHHVDKIQIGTETKHRTETYTEQDGFKQEPYTEREQRGYRTETYTERIQTGTRRVKAGVRDLGNGRFKQLYRDEPVYGDVERTRQVPRYETVTKYREVPNMVRKTRQVPYEAPVYREDPVHQTWHTYTVDRWQRCEPLVRAGEGTQVQWAPEPDGRLVRAASRGASYELWLSDEDGGTHTFRLRDESFWKGFAVGQQIKRSEFRAYERSGQAQRSN